MNKQPTLQGILSQFVGNYAQQAKKDTQPKEKTSPTNSLMLSTY